MLKKTVTIAAVAALVVAGALIAVGQTGQASACDGKTETASTGSSCSSKAKTASASSCCAKQAKTAHYEQVKKAADEIPNRVNSRVVLSGTYTCGSCDLGMTDTCQAFLKTADGKLYPMEHTSTVKAMKKSGTKNFEITARVTKQGGAKYLDVTNYTAM